MGLKIEKVTLTCDNTDCASQETVVVVVLTDGTTQLAEGEAPGWTHVGDPPEYLCPDCQTP